MKLGIKAQWVLTFHQLPTSLEHSNCFFLENLNTPVKSHISTMSIKQFTPHRGCYFLLQVVVIHVTE